MTLLAVISLLLALLWAAPRLLLVLLRRPGGSSRVPSSPSVPRRPRDGAEDAEDAEYVDLPGPREPSVAAPLAAEEQVVDADFEDI